MREHVQIDIEARAIHCERCGAREALRLPAGASALQGQVGIFLSLHQGCREEATDA